MAPIASPISQTDSSFLQWYDVIAAISTRSSPRFLTLYRRLFGPLISREKQPTGFSMDMLMGCPGDILLIYAETAALAHWKQQQQLTGLLDPNELLTRGAAIENRLLVSNIAVSTAPTASTGMSAQMQPPSPSGGHSGPSSVVSTHIGAGPVVASGMGAVGASESSLAGTSMKEILDTPAAAMLYLSVTRVFLHAASLFLASVINDPSPSKLKLLAMIHPHLLMSSPSPGNPDIRNSVRSVLDDLRTVPERTIDRALALPLTLVGCLAETAEQREFVHARLRSLEEVIGNMRSVRLIMERAWAVHEAHGGIIDWYDIMKNSLGAEVLLI